ncbi:hypothetical protein M1L60_02760 [Actinoplanes sp. TRM 88003]|uniref:Uncharacterized protein n=1 Tax=Paractinoplanes aksuensis TaxID=2939490 RepID=A0ABT1DFC3_9ACTN|nr:hypothetical protein [Actinoplanes aksuensis]MCO8269509.1 hypothetical protein [Actinoplanes aksuensis]
MSPLRELLADKPPHQLHIDLDALRHGSQIRNLTHRAIFPDEANARRYHRAMLDQGAVERPGVRSVVWDVAEVGAESATPGQ